MTDATPIETQGPNVNHPRAVTLDKLRILHDFVVVRPLAPPSKAHGGLVHMPEIAQERERSHRGIVVVCGPGDWNEYGTARVPMTVRPGDLVFFGKYAGTQESVGGQSVLVMREPECRMSVPSGNFELVLHDDAKLDHLVEDWCEVCHGIPLEQASAERLALEREQQLVGQGPGPTVD
jgi:chaperonin GroES